MDDLSVYEKLTCTTCRKLTALLAERGIDAERELVQRPVVVRGDRAVLARPLEAARPARRCRT